MPGEFELIAALRDRMRRAGAPAVSPELVLGSGDDAALLAGEGPIAISVDAAVEGIHFRRPPFDLPSIGHKALAAALSDLAAIGARAGEALVQLGLPADLDEPAVLELADGIGAVAAAHGIAVAGGDISRSPLLFCAVTVIGHAAAEDDFVRRAGARPGEALAITGELGGAAAGLLLLERPELGDRLEGETAEALRRRQLRPEPRLAAGEALAGAGASAMIDISDGIGGDAGHLAAASGVEVRVDVARLPIQAGVVSVAEAAETSLEEIVVAGGEDYELLVALPPARLEAATAAVAATGSRLTVVGEVADGAGVAITGASGDPVAASGFDQLRQR